MWLINTTTLKLEFFTPPKVPLYAILSHTWGDGEVGFREFQDLKKARKKPGFAKIERTCQLARSTGIGYAWVDTCCIDKSSSAELSEAINSMYSWYRRSEICYAYLIDWEPRWAWEDLKPLDIGGDASDTEAHGKDVKPSSSTGNIRSPVFPLKWFTRGWTLQELIAPSVLRFYDQKWNFKGFKSEAVVLTNLARITGITPHVLRNGSDGSLRKVCLGQRMSWAAHRETSRTEDIAYCLMGIFQVNMPMLYGEGDRAFLRLQEEIVKTSTDLSIFAWTPPDEDMVFRTQARGILAHCPREFRQLNDCSPLQPRIEQAEEVAITNKGLRIRACLFPIREDSLWSTNGVECLYLDCTTSRGLQFILLRRVRDIFVTVKMKKHTISATDFSQQGKTQTIYIARDWDEYALETYNEVSETKIRLRLENSLDYRLRLELPATWPPSFYDSHGRTISGGNPLFGLLKLQVMHLSPLSQLRRKVNDIYVVCCGNQQAYAVALATKDRVSALQHNIEGKWDVDPMTARQRLFESFSEFTKVIGSEVLMEDSSMGVCLLIHAVTELDARGDMSSLSIQIEDNVGKAPVSV